MAVTGKVEGPDFSKGVDIEILKEGESLLGHFAGESVLLVRTQEKFFAVGAKCSHYGGPLQEGLIVGDSVHCPWHHACFDLQTGEVLKAPALNPIPAWTTEVLNGKVYVRDKKAFSVSVRPGTETQKFIIIGTGAAGTAAAVNLRRHGFQGSIHLISADKELPYDRPNLSKDYLAGNAKEEWVSLYSKDFYDSNKIHLNLATRVEKLDSHRQSVFLSNGETLRYDRCLLATGGIPVRPSIPGIEQGHVYLLRTLQDYIARWPDPHSRRSIRVEHWEVAERQGQVAALNMMGDRVRFEEAPFFWTQHYHLSLGYVGYSDRFDRMDVMASMDKADFAVAYYEDQRIAALLTVGWDQESLLVEEAWAHFNEPKIHDILRSYETKAELRSRDL